MSRLSFAEANGVPEATTTRSSQPGVRGDLSQQGGLARTRSTDDHEQPTRTRDGRGQQLIELRQLGRPPTQAYRAG